VVVCFCGFRIRCPPRMDSLQHCHSPALLVKRFLVAICFGILLCCVWGIPRLHSAPAFDPYHTWDQTLTPPSSSPFPAIEPFEATYRFGWEGVSAGGATVSVKIGDDAEGKPNFSRRRINADGGPNEWVRKLWNYHADYQGEAEANGEVPSWFHMDESVSRGMMFSDAVFTPGAVFACHHLTTESKPWLYTPLPGVRDLFAAMLLVRSQPLRDGDHLRLTTFPDRNPYLVDLTVAGHDTLRIMGEKIRAIRFTIAIQTIETMGPNIGRLAPHKKFRSGRIWMSDDACRIPLKAEVDVFVGSVFAELVEINPVL